MKAKHIKINVEIN